MIETVSVLFYSGVVVVYVLAMISILMCIGFAMFILWMAWRTVFPKKGKHEEEDSSESEFD